MNGVDEIPEAYEEMDSESRIQKSGPKVESVFKIWFKRIKRLIERKVEKSESC